MRRFGGAPVMVATLLLLGSRAVCAQAPRLTVSGNPGLLRINTAVAGSDPMSVSNAATTYNVRVNASSNKRVTAQLNTAMPSGVTLTINLAAPPGATSLGTVSLTTTANDVVVNITNVNVTRSITYQLSATAAAGVILSSTRTVTLTLIDYP